MKKLGRPKVKIDLHLAESLANLHCTIKEIAAVINIPVTTLQSRTDFRLVYAKGIESGKAKLRRIQYRLAEKSAAMAIFLGKNYLGQIDTPLIDQSTHQHFVIFRNPKAITEKNASDIRSRTEVKDTELSAR